MVVPSKSCDLRGSGDTVCGLCALVSGSHGKGYYTRAASVFALAPGARHNPRTDILCGPFMVPWSEKIQFFYVWREVCLFLNQTLQSQCPQSKKSMGCGGFGFGCCLWPCKDPAHCLLKNQNPASCRFMGMPAQNCPTWLPNPLWACAEVTKQQRKGAR